MTGGDHGSSGDGCGGDDQGTDGNNNQDGGRSSEDRDRGSYIHHGEWNGTIQFFFLEDK